MSSEYLVSLIQVLSTTSVTKPHLSDETRNGAFTSCPGVPHQAGWSGIGSVLRKCPVSVFTLADL